MDTKKKLELLEDMMELENGTLSGETVLAELEEWDSLAKLSLIVLMDEECGKTLAGEQIKEFVTVQDILDFMG